LIRLATADEATGIGQSVRRSDFGLRFLAAMVILETGQAVGPDLSPASHAGSMERLSGIVNQTLPMGMVYRFIRSRSASARLS
jgi:hypothetical protein